MKTKAFHQYHACDDSLKNANKVRLNFGQYGKFKGPLTSILKISEWKWKSVLFTYIPMIFPFSLRQKPSSFVHAVKCVIFTKSKLYFCILGSLNSVGFASMWYFYKPETLVDDSTSSIVFVMMLEPRVAFSLSETFF